MTIESGGAPNLTGVQLVGALITKGRVLVGNLLGAAAEMVYRPSTDFVLRPGDPDPLFQAYADFATLYSSVGTDPTALGLRRLIVDVFTLGYSVGTHNGGDDASVLTDTTQAWEVDALVGRNLYNLTNNSRGVITANTATTITATMTGDPLGENDFDDGDFYLVTQRAVLPAAGGPWDLAGLTMTSITPNFGVLDIEDGAKFTELGELVNLEIFSASSSHVWDSMDPLGSAFSMRGSSRLITDGSSPLIRVQTGQALRIALFENSRIGSGFNVIECDAGGQCQIVLHDSAMLQSSALKGAGSFTVEKRGRGAYVSESQPDATAVSFDYSQLYHGAADHVVGKDPISHTALTDIGTLTHAELEARYDGKFSLMFTGDPGGNGEIELLGFHELTDTAHALASGTPLTLAKPCYHGHVALSLSGVTGAPFNLTLTGTSVDESTGVLSPADTEVIEITGDGYVQSSKSWIDAPVASVPAGPTATVDAYRVTYWDRGNADFKVVGSRFEFTPNNPTWSAKASIRKVNNDGSVSTIYDFSTSSTSPDPKRAANGDTGKDKRGDLSTTLLGAQNEGIVASVDLTAIGHFLLEVKLEI